MRAPVPSWITSAPTLAELGEKLGIPAGALDDTVARWNAVCADGDDPDFGRGRSVNDRWWGDAQKQGMDATLGPIDAAPFYAVAVHPGALGTKGGPRTTGDGQVIDVDGAPDPWPVRSRQRDVVGDGYDLRRWRRNAGARNGLRLPRR